MVPAPIFPSAMGEEEEEFEEEIPPSPASEKPDVPKEEFVNSIDTVAIHG